MFSAAELIARPRIGGRYRVEGLLGKGGTGAVYRVHDESTDCLLALKSLASDNVDDLLRFRREFHTLAGLKHPCIVEVHDYGIDGRAPYYTMELLERQDPRTLAPASAAVACRLVRDVASALAFLHARRLLHRDVKPQNVRFTATGSAKLIDFGLLATVGTSGDVAGTPPYLAPENVGAVPLDHLADLFGLGALAYWLLTSKHAYPALAFEDLFEIWQRRPAPPSTYAEGIPAALDDLVLSLLSREPLARPGSAAEVIDRLEAMVELPPLPRVEVARGYLRSPSLVGRREEMARLKELLERADDGKGATALVEAPSGRGKTRLLRELALHSQIAGATVVLAGREQGAGGPHWLLRDIARSLVKECAEDAVSTAQAHASALARTLPELGLRAGPTSEVDLDPAEQRLKLRTAVGGWFAALSARRALVIVIDDFQRADEGSAAVVAALAHVAKEHRLLLVIGLRTDETMRAPHALVLLRGAATRLRLRGLDDAETLAFVRALFGDVPNLPRLAGWINNLAGGSPLHCTELARHLVDRDVVRYADGAWIIPDDLGEEALPRGLKNAMNLRVRTLEPTARELGQALSVHGGELPLATCIQLGDAEEAVTFRALDELVREEVLVGGGGTYRFRHDGLREALLRDVDDERRRILHRRAADALSPGGEVAAGDEAAVGFHLREAGEKGRAAALLERAGRRLFEAQSLSDAMPPLEAALEIYEEQGAPPELCLDLRRILALAGIMGDRNALLRHAERSIALAWRYAGLDHAERLRRFIGRPLALVVGILLASMSRAVAPRRRRGPSPIVALSAAIMFAGTSAVVYCHLCRREPLMKLLERLEVFRTFRTRAPYAVVLLCETFRLLIEGRRRAVRDNCQAILDILAKDRLAPLSDLERRVGASGAWDIHAWTRMIDQDPGFEDDLQSLAREGLRSHDYGAEVYRALYHRLRGEEETAVQIHTRADRTLAEIGSMWTYEGLIAWGSSFGYAIVGDVSGLRRTIESMERLIEQGYHLDHHLGLARGNYLRERGDLAASRDALEKALEGARAFSMLEQPALAALAETLLALGDHEAAIVAARRGSELGLDANTGLETYRLLCARTWAMAEAAQGAVPAAEERLDRALLEAIARPSPSITGSLHEARARIALLAGDQRSYRYHVGETQRWFAATRNPVLLGRLERLSALSGSHRGSVPEWVSDVPTLTAAVPKEAAAPESSDGDPTSDVSVERSR